MEQAAEKLNVFGKREIPPPPIRHIFSKWISSSPQEEKRFFNFYNFFRCLNCFQRPLYKEVENDLGPGGGGVVSMNKFVRHEYKWRSVPFMVMLVVL